MLVIIVDTFSNHKEEEGKIHLVSNRTELPLKKNRWQFNWRELFAKNKDAHFFQILNEKNEVQGMLMFSMLYGNMPYMNCIEVAPHNLGRKGRYANVAGCLIAFACKLSFRYGKNNYYGWLSFVSKTSLINYYEYEYGATVAVGQKMFFSPIAAMKLIDNYLIIEDYEIYEK